MSSSALDKVPSERHDSKTVNRAVLCLALFAALFLAAARCVGGFGSLGVSTVVACSAPSEESHHEAPATAPALDDDSDDASEPLLPPAALQPEPFEGLAGPCQTLTVLVLPAVFSSHAPSLERPPRA